MLSLWYRSARLWAERSAVTHGLHARHGSDDRP